MHVFNSLTSTLLAKRKQVHEITRSFAKSPSKGNLKRITALFAECGDNLVIEAGFHCEYGDHIKIGDNCFFNINCTLLDGPESSGAITIGNDCLVGPNVQIYAVGHDVNPTSRLSKRNLASPIVIGNNVWIGGGAIILPGVSIGDNAVIAAGAVVTKNIAANTLVAGNPAKFIRIIESD